jgi:hypothetical protein
LNPLKLRHVLNVCDDDGNDYEHDGDLLCLVAGQYGEASQELHELL